MALPKLLGTEIPDPRRFDIDFSFLSQGCKIPHTSKARCTLRDFQGRRTGVGTFKGVCFFCHGGQGRTYRGQYTKTSWAVHLQATRLALQIPTEEYQYRLSTVETSQSATIEYPMLCGSWSSYAIATASLSLDLLCSCFIPHAQLSLVVQFSAQFWWQNHSAWTKLNVLSSSQRSHC